ncbi:MAG TPA: oligoendopeptidase F [Limnochordia bacterium]|nr:oligoendopeptidase F [Limnochordia bacterium]
MSEATVDALLERSAIPERLKWRLEDLYADLAAWEADAAQVAAELPKLAAYEGRLGESAEVLAEALALFDRTNERFGRLFVFAHMRKDEENQNATYQGLADRAQGLAVELGAASAFIVPELLQIPAATLTAWVAAEPALAAYAHYLDDVTRVRPHVLSAAEERILAMAGELEAAPRNIFVMLDNADLTFGEVTDEAGRPIELTHGRYLTFLESRQRAVRRQAFEQLYKAYRGHINTLAAAYSASVKKDVFNARVRNYPSALEAALSATNIPTAVYDQLIATVRARLPLLYRYLDLRKRILGLDELHLYDVYVPIVPDFDVKIGWEEAKARVQAALRPLGDEYGAALAESFAARWIDVLESRGKTSGAYSWGAYPVHPFVLMNYQENLDNVFTLAHEMGHALHSTFTFKHQPHIYAEYTIFVAEVASTLNEALLTHHLLETERDPRMRMYVLNHQLETFRGTLYRQTMFAEFERETHRRAEAGEPLTAEGVSAYYRELVADYFGPGVVIDAEIDVEWARIPHFYTPFYVYQYATGLSAAQALAGGILKEGEPAVARYLRFLSRGSSAYSIELLRDAGVDMTTPEPVNRALDVFAASLDELERLLDEAGA